MLAAVLLLAALPETAPVQPEAVATEVVTVACAARHLCVERPDDEWDEASCSDYELDTALIEAAGHGDRSALALLEQRYGLAKTYRERHRIGIALLGRVADDSAIWNELTLHAENAIRFASDEPGPNKELEAWCAEHGYDADRYGDMAEDTLVSLMNEPRARPLLLRAAHSKRGFLAAIGIYGLCGQRDESLLPQIDEALSKNDEALNKNDHASLASALAAFHSEAADRIARKYLDEEDLESYHEERRMGESSP